MNALSFSLLDSRDINLLGGAAIRVSEQWLSLLTSSAAEQTLRRTTLQPSNQAGPEELWQGRRRL